MSVDKVTGTGQECDYGCGNMYGARVCILTW